SFASERPRASRFANPGLSTDGQISVLGYCGRDEIHHCAHRRGAAQIAVNDKPNVAHEGWYLVAESDKVAVALAEKAGQAAYSDPGVDSDQVFADVIQFADHRAVAGNSEQPSLLRQVGVALIKGDKLPPFRRGQMGIGPVGIEAEGHRPDLPRHAASF